MDNKKTTARATGTGGRTWHLAHPEGAEERPMARSGARSLRLVDDTVGAEHIDLHLNILGPGSERDAPYHIHQRVENVYYVLKGTLGLRLGDEEVHVEAGNALFIPPHLPHSVWNAGDTEAHLLEIYAPPGPDFVRLDEGE